MRGCGVFSGQEGHQVHAVERGGRGQPGDRIGGGGEIE
jgi:hypothetical protein